MEKEILDSELIQQANIPLVLNSYMDIFSSFDPRSFSERALSDDFLIETKRAARDKDDTGIELILAVPKEKRNLNDEFKIRKRLKEHFHKHSIEKEKEMGVIRKEGFIWVLVGALLIFGIGLGLIYVQSSIIQSLLTIFEIPGWFLVWEGMGKVFLDTRKIEPDYTFYKKMANCSVIFKSY